MMFGAYLYSEGNVLFCCGHGRTRSPVYLMVYMMIILGLSFHDAFKKVNVAFQECRKEDMLIWTNVSLLSFVS